MLSRSNCILDTLKFKEQKIFLKNYHAERSYEALAFKKFKISLEKVLRFYDFLEEETFRSIQSHQILRILIPLASVDGNPFEHLSDPLQFLLSASQVEMIDTPKFSTNPAVQISNTTTFPSGQGEQTYKWSDRDAWNKLLAKKNSSADDVIAINEKGHVSETSRCNLFFFDSSNDIVFTPNLESGCINGVYRRFVMSNGFINLPELGHKKVIEKNILTTDVKDYSLYLANSIREVLPARIL